MRNTSIASCILVLAASTLLPYTVAAQRSLSAAQRAAITDSVGFVADSVFAAGRRRDLDRMFSWYSPSATLLHDGKPEEWKTHQAAARALYNTLRAVDVRPLGHEIEVLSPTVALWRGQYAYSLTDSAGHVIGGSAAQTWVLARENAGWRIVHIHLSDPMPAR
jgi:ketosteroid isomerase-like protein